MLTHVNSALTPQNLYLVFSSNLDSREFDDYHQSTRGGRQRAIGRYLAAFGAHHSPFLTEDNIAQLFPLVLNDYLPAVNVWVAEERPGHPCGFIGLNGNKVEMLFIDADQRGKGVGKALLTHAETLHDELQLDVNEQNPQASGFYRHYGFVITGRSPLDGRATRSRCCT